MKKQLFSLVASFMICFETHANTPSLQKKVIDNSDYPFTEHEDLNKDQEDPPLSNLLDLDKMIKDFILETKKIEFPEYPGAFNPSMIRWRGSVLMSFRLYKPQNGSTNPFALVCLNENFEPISVPQVFELPFHNPVLPSKQQDPRLISVGERIFVVYNNILENVINREIRRMFIAEVFYDGEKFTMSKPECLVEFEEKSDMRYEKNWVPFEYDGELLLAYSILPHRILRPLCGKGACQTVATSIGNIQWKWGDLKGGTQAVCDGDHYLAFFHSWIDLPTVQSNGKKISHYFVGAYTFEAQPPFSITAMSPEPIVSENFYRPPYYKTWKPLRCIFPAGIIFDENYIWISYGRQDHEVWIAKLDKKALLQSLIPVSSKESKHLLDNANIREPRP
jgi:predicted GH43/DUF377 family glycosyl hydrolase